MSTPRKPVVILVRTADGDVPAELTLGGHVSGTIVSSTETPTEWVVVIKEDPK